MGLELIVEPIGQDTVGFGLIVLIVLIVELGQDAGGSEGDPRRERELLRAVPARCKLSNVEQ